MSYSYLWGLNLNCCAIRDPPLKSKKYPKDHSQTHFLSFFFVVSLFKGSSSIVSSLTHESFLFQILFSAPSSVFGLQWYGWEMDVCMVEKDGRMEWSILLFPSCI